MATPSERMRAPSPLPRGEVFFGSAPTGVSERANSLRAQPQRGDTLLSPLTERLIRAPSPLPRAEVFCGLAPSASRLRLLPPSVSSTVLNAGPGSPVTGTPDASPSSSAASADAVSGLIPRRSRPVSAPVPESTASSVSCDEEKEQVGHDDGMGEEAAPTRAYDEFSEDDYTDRFDSFVPTEFDRDAAMDDYLVFSRRYGCKPANAREVRDELPRKRNGAGLWERLYSDMSGTFSARVRVKPAAVSMDNAGLRRMFSGDASARQRLIKPLAISAAQDAAASTQEDQPASTPAIIKAPAPLSSTEIGTARSSMAPRSMSARSEPLQPHRRGFSALESTKTLAIDDFLEYQDFRARSQATSKSRKRWMKRCRGMLRSLVRRRR